MRAPVGESAPGRCGPRGRCVGCRARGARVGACVAAGVLWLRASAALAGNEDELLVGDDAALSGGAVTAMVHDGSALYYNPAGLAGAANDSVDLTASAFVLRRYRLPALLSTSAGQQAKGDFTEIVSAPTCLSFVRRLSPRWVAGFGVFVPRSADLVLRSSLPLTLDGRPASSLAALGVSHARYVAAAGLGLQLTQRLSIGLALHGVYDGGSLSSLFAGGFVSGNQPGPDSTAADFASEGFVQQQVISNQANLGFEPALGLQLDVGEHWRAGLALRGPGYSLYSYQRASTVDSQGGPVLDAFIPADDEQTRFAVERMLALRTAAAIAYRFGVSWVALEVDYQSAARSTQLGVNWVPAVNARLGGRVQLSPAVVLGAGLFTDRSNEPSPAGYPETHINFYGGTLGFEVGNEYTLAPGQAHRTIAFSTTLALRYAHGTGQVGGVRIDLSAPEPGEIAQVSTPPGPVSVDELGVHVGSALYF